MSGNSNGARNLGPALECCDVQPEASFKGADLRLMGLGMVFPRTKQLMRARIDPRNTAPVETGTVHISGRVYRLCQLIRFLPGLVVEEATVNTRLGPRPLEIAEISGCPSMGTVPWRDWLYDVAGMASEVDCRCSPDPNSDQSAECELSDDCRAWFMHAPGVSFRNVLAKGGWLSLAGNFERASFQDSVVKNLVLDSGCFRQLDLEHATVGHITIQMDQMCATSIRLPKKIRSIRFRWFTGGDSNKLIVLPSDAASVVDAWDSPNRCHTLAEILLARVPLATGIQGQKILNSQGKTVKRILRGRFMPRDVEAAAGLVARRNQLTS